MKTAISVSDEIFDKVSRRAHDLGISRSEFFSRAAARYLDELDAGSITEQINEALASLTRADDSASAAVETGRRVGGSEFERVAIDSGRSAGWSPEGPKRLSPVVSE